MTVCLSLAAHCWQILSCLHITQLCALLLQLIDGRQRLCRVQGQNLSSVPLSLQCTLVSLPTCEMNSYGNQPTNCQVHVHTSYQQRQGWSKPYGMVECEMCLCTCGLGSQGNSNKRRIQKHRRCMSSVSSLAVCPHQHCNALMALMKRLGSGGSVFHSGHDLDLV